ncbi:uncharacterized protein LOC119167085 isoform X2 [Rhipicephalus microplus]|uniref:uncharacterized protein LOC119167085 isoform X2 n=1 Tax=Rhipicephalus microplus TaxID=6941 RepID=UPI003F6A762C
MAMMAELLRIFVLVTFILAYLGNAEDYDNEYDNNDGYDYGCTEEHQRALNSRPLSSRALMWWPYVECRNGLPYVTCYGDLKCNHTRQQWDGLPTARRLWTRKRANDRVSQACEFVDAVLQQGIPTLSRESHRLSLPSYNFKVDRNAWTNRDLKVKITLTRFKDFSRVVSKINACVPSMKNGNVSVSCDLNIGGIEAMLLAETKGDSLLGDAKLVRVNAFLYPMVGKLEVTCAMNKPAFLRSFVVKGDYIEVTVGENLDLNPLRMSIFKTHIRHYIGTQQEEKLDSYYEERLKDAFSRVTFFFF